MSDRQIAEALIDAGLVLHVEDGSRGNVVIDFDGDLAIGTHSIRAPTSVSTLVLGDVDQNRELVD